jgi:hypothetical protein
MRLERHPTVNAVAGLVSEGEMVTCVGRSARGSMRVVDTGEEVALRSFGIRELRVSPLR